MNIQQKLSQLLNQYGENEVIEFKEAKNNFDSGKLGKYFSALSNEANLKGQSAAWLVFGINDKQQVIGSGYRVKDKDLHSLKAEIANHTTNRITFVEIHTLDVESRRVILFEIPAAPQGLPVAYKGHYYGRDGEDLGPLNLQELESIRAQNKWQDWSAELISGAELSDLCSDALTKAKQLYLDKNKNKSFAADIANWDDITFLNKAKLAIKGKLTRAAIILLGKEESESLLSPSTPKITWLLKDKDGVDKDYEHFSSPLLLSADEVFKKIRNLKYRYMSDNSLFPEEVEQYDPYIIREALNNCIAHQDYTLGGKITVVEFEDGRLCFSNMGHFIPESVEYVIKTDAPEPRYRNTLLANAMVELKMIDTIGSGIKKMFMIQKSKFFPLPEYDLSHNRVLVTFTGKVLDINYANKIASMPELSIDYIFLLDRVQKGLALTDTQIRQLKKLNLIEGRKPNFHVSANVAKQANDKAQYIKNKGFDDAYYKKLICDYLNKFGEAKRSDIDTVLLDKLPGVLDENQKSNKVKNLLQSLRAQGEISVTGKIWKMSK